MQRIADRDMHERDIIALVPLAENKNRMRVIAVSPYNPREQKNNKNDAGMAFLQPKSFLTI